MQFIGLPITIPIAGTKEQVVHAFDFGYLDSNSRLWWVFRGDISDGHSVPNALHSIAGHPFSYPLPAFLHDSAYIHKQHTRKLTDAMFKEVLTKCGANGHKSNWFYRAVKWFGKKAWQHQDPADASRYELIPRQILNIPSALLIPRHFMPQLETARLKALEWQCRDDG